METLFNGRYKIVKTIGSGGMSTVYLAESVSLGTKWAIKAIEKKQSDNFDLLAEPNILKRLNHPALPRIIDIEQDDSFLYIAEDYIEGSPLDKQLAYRKYFDEATVIEWAKQLCEVLLYLHGQKPNPIIYRDLKPSNIIVSPDNQVKVIDFGIAREFKTDSGSDTSYMGTRGYAAPEQYGTSQTDARTDIYSLGVTMYHLLTGKSPNEPPYEFRLLRGINPEFSEGMEYIVNKCVQNNPINRYQSARELLYDLDNIHIFNSYYKKQKSKEKLIYLLKACFAAGFAALIYFSYGQITAERTEKYKQLVDTGNQALGLYQFEPALTAFNSAIKMNRSGFDGYFGTAQILLKQGRYEEGVAYLNEVAEKLPEITKNPRYSYLKGTTFYENKDYKSAVPLFQKAVEGDSEREEYARDLAVSYAKLGQLDKARALLDKMDKSSDVSKYVDAQVLAAEGKKTDAVNEFKTVIETSENEDIRKNAYLEAANIYKERRHSDSKALTSQILLLELAVKDLKTEDDLIITEMMAEAYFTDQNYDMAVEKFQKLLEIGYDRSYIYRNLAIIYQQTGDLTSAEEWLMKMKEKYPDDYHCYLQLAFVYLEMEGNGPEQSRDYSRVTENYDLAVRFAPNGANTSDIMPLTSKIRELKQKGWI